MENPSSDINHHRHHNGLLDLGSHRDVPAVSPLEQEVLNEYARLALNMESVCLLFDHDCLFSLSLLSGP